MLSDYFPVLLQILAAIGFAATMLIMSAAAMDEGQPELLQIVFTRVKSSRVPRAGYPRKQES